MQIVRKAQSSLQVESRHPWRGASFPSKPQRGLRDFHRRLLSSVMPLTSLAFLPAFLALCAPTLVGKCQIQDQRNVLANHVAQITSEERVGNRYERGPSVCVERSGCRRRRQASQHHNPATPLLSRHNRRQSRGAATATARVASPPLSSKHTLAERQQNLSCVQGGGDAAVAAGCTAAQQHVILRAARNRKDGMCKQGVQYCTVLLRERPAGIAAREGTAW